MSLRRALASGLVALALIQRTSDDANRHFAQGQRFLAVREVNVAKYYAERLRSRSDSTSRVSLHERPCSAAGPGGLDLHPGAREREGACRTGCCLRTGRARALT